MSDSVEQGGAVLGAETDCAPAGSTPRPQPPAANLLARQRAIVAMGRRAVAPPELPVLMQDAAALLADVLGTPYNLVAELASDSQPAPLQLTLRKTGGSQPSAPLEQTDTGGSDSLAGYVLKVAHPVVVADLSAEKRFDDPLLRKHGIRSALAVPLRLAERPFGTLAACADRLHKFEDEDLLFAETIAHLVTTTIGRARAERTLTDERRLAQGVLETVDALVLVLDARGQIISVNSACQRLTGFSREETEGRHFWSVFCLAKEVDLCRRHLECLREKRMPVEYESVLLTKHAEQRQVAWSCSPVSGSDGTLQSIIATGVDVTDQRRVREEAEVTVRAAEQARQVMARALPATERAGTPTGHADDAEAPPAEGCQRNAGVRPAPPAGQWSPSALVERRRHPRLSFSYWQRIAAVVDGRLPRGESFVDVQCQDISASGFSFLSPAPPPSETLVVALGVPPRVTYLVARIVSMRRIEKRGQREFLIGCAYIGRAAY